MFSGGRFRYSWWHLGLKDFVKWNKTKHSQRRKKDKQCFAHFTFNVSFPIWKNPLTNLTETLSPVGTSHHGFTDMNGVYTCCGSSSMTRNLWNLTLSRKGGKVLQPLSQGVHICSHRVKKHEFPPRGKWSRFDKATLMKKVKKLPKLERRCEKGVDILMMVFCVFLSLSELSTILSANGEVSLN